MSNHPHTTNDSMASVTSGTGSASRESMGAEPAAPFRTTPVVDEAMGTEAIDSFEETSQLAPSPLTHCFDKEHYKAMKAQLKERVGKRRYKHSVGVAKTAKKMAKVYGLDPEQARMAGLVHDWDKCYRGEESTQRALDLGLEIDSAILYEMPWLLHGPTAALALSREFPEWGAETFQAIERHTCGAADMSPLDCIIYVADIIEPGRDYGPGSGLDELRALVGEVPLQELYYQAFKFTLRYLLEGDRRMFPGTAEIYNVLIVQHAQWSGIATR